MNTPFSMRFADAITVFQEVCGVDNIYSKHYKMTKTILIDKIVMTI